MNRLTTALGTLALCALYAQDLPDYPHKRSPCILHDFVDRGDNTKSYFETVECRRPIELSKDARQRVGLGPDEQVLGRSLFYAKMKGSKFVYGAVEHWDMNGKPIGGCYYGDRPQAFLPVVPCNPSEKEELSKTFTEIKRAIDFETMLDELNHRYPLRRKQ